MFTVREAHEACAGSDKRDAVFLSKHILGVVFRRAVLVGRGLAEPEPVEFGRVRVDVRIVVNRVCVDANLRTVREVGSVRQVDTGLHHDCLEDSPTDKSP